METTKPLSQVPTAVPLVRAYCICGLLAMATATLVLRLAVSSAPWFSWTDNALSDLAGMPGDRPMWAARGLTSIYFNGCLAVTGILTIIFGIGLLKCPLLAKRVGRMGALIFVSAASSLFAMGVFSNTFGSLHNFFSILFFFLVPASLILIGTALLGSPQRPWGWYTIALGIMGFGPQLIPWPWKGEAIPDTISMLPILPFVITFDIRLLSRSRAQTL